jgi:hypothetical protein
VYHFQDLDQTAKALLAKNGESNGFIRSDCDQAVSAMMENVTPQRAILALIAGGTRYVPRVIFSLGLKPPST